MREPTCAPSVCVLPSQDEQSQSANPQDEDSCSYHLTSLYHLRFPKMRHLVRIR
jgi:hypothetical protein